MATAASTSAESLMRERSIVTGTGTRALVDPEIAAVLDDFPPFNLSADTLAGVRERLGQRRADAPDPAESLPGVTRTEHLVPGADGDPAVRVLCFVPAGRDATGAGLVWMHGGGFVMGAAEDDEFTCRRLARDTGAAVVSVDYRLAPETVAPGPVHDCYAALKWVCDNAGALGVDPARLVVGGASAGGGLAACLAILARDRGEIAVSGQLLVYPMLDDRTASTTEPNPLTGEFVWTPADNRFGWASLLGADPGSATVSPYAAAARVADVRGLPPALISVGALDLFLDEDMHYAGRLLRAGIATELHVYPGAYHGFNMVPEARVSQAYFRDLRGALGRFTG